MGMSGSNRRSAARTPGAAAKKGRAAASRAASGSGKAKAVAKSVTRSIAKPTAKPKALIPCKFVKGKVHCTIASDFKAGRDVQELIIAEAERLGYSAHSIFALRLALEEVLINAIKHGNRFDPDKVVHVDVAITPAEVEIIVEDEGPGFHRGSVPDPRLEENLERCSGRGILLVEAYMTHVEYGNGGRRIRMTKKNEPHSSVG